jgi:SAM-dependent methyltransferase
MHASTITATRRFAEVYVQGVPRIADIGSLEMGGGSLRPIFRDSEYIGFDIAAGLGVDVLMTDPDCIPVADASFDVALSTNTLEHIRRPWVTVREMARILKPGGLMFLLVPMPNAHRYHAHPIDCWRAYIEGVRGLFEEAGMEVLELWEEADHDTVGVARKP